MKPSLAHGASGRPTGVGMRFVISAGILLRYSYAGSFRWPRTAAILCTVAVSRVLIVRRIARWMGIVAEALTEVVWPSVRSTEVCKIDHPVFYAVLEFACIGRKLVIGKLVPLILHRLPFPTQFPLNLSFIQSERRPSYAANAGTKCM